jgi:hypothetical protein
MRSFISSTRLALLIPSTISWYVGSLSKTTPNTGLCEKDMLEAVPSQRPKRGLLYIFVYVE